MTKIRKTIDEFKQQNGNDGYTQRDMLMYLVSKIDKIDSRLDDGSNKISTNKAWVKGLSTIFIIALSIITGVLAWMFIKILEIYRIIGT